MPYMKGYPETKLHSQQIVEKALAYIGHDNMLALFDYFEERGLRRNEILDKPEKFAEALERLFGTGAEVIEKEIIKEICLRSDKVQFDSQMTIVEAIRKLSS